MVLLQHDTYAPCWVHTVGRYQVLGEIGRGGMGVVYRAYDPQLRREVAIKCLDVDRSMRGKDIERFKREVQILARFRHPNVVSIHAVGLHEGRPYFVQDLVDGESLSVRINTSGPLPLALAARVIQRLAEALQAAHDQGILHRDVKPANVLLSESGEPILIDFGLAKDMSHSLSRTGLTKTGHSIGTPGYWSPEQVCGERDKIGPRADVYGLGATLYALVVGAPPFEGRGVAGNAVLTVAQPPPRPSSLRPEVDSSLEAICLKCLEKESEDRYTSANELAAELARYLNGEPVLARRGSGSAARPRRLLVVAGSGLILALCGLPLTLAPGLELESPVSGLATRRAIRVSGEVTGVGPVLGVEVNGKAVDADGGRFEIELDLPGGEHEVVVAALGLLRRAELRRAVRVDRTPPVLSLMAPGDWEVLGADHVNLSGSFQDASCVEITVAGLAGHSSGSFSPGERFTLRAPLQIGVNELQVSCVDAAGNAGVIVQLRVLRCPPEDDTEALLGRYRVPGKNSEYRVTETVVIADDESLVLAAGAIVRFSEAAALVCRGQLWCVGTSKARVTLTSSGSSWAGVSVLGDEAFAALAWTELSRAAPNRIDSAVATRTKNVGGGLTVSAGGRLLLVDSTLRDCEAPGKRRGGGLRVEGNSEAWCAVDCVRVLLASCSARRGGGAYLGAYSRSSFLACEFRGNQASQYGGGAAAEACPGSAAFTSVVFRENTSRRWGGGASLYQPARLLDCAFIGNTAADGGGISARDGRGGPLELTRLRFEGNISQNGGGAHLTRSATLRDCVFVENEVQPGGPGERRPGGGGLRLTAPGEFTLEHVKFLANVADSGGGLFAGPVELSVSKCHFRGNTAQGVGGGLLLHGAFPLPAVVTQSVIEGNRAREGAGVWIVGREASFNETRFLSNIAGLRGGGLGSRTGPDSARFRLSLSRCDFSKNNAPSGPDLFLSEKTICADGDRVGVSAEGIRRE